MLRCKRSLLTTFLLIIQVTLSNSFVTNGQTYEIKRITENTVMDLNPSLNDHGDIAWEGVPEGESGWNIYFYDFSGDVIRQVTTAGSNTNASLNNRGTIAYTRVHDGNGNNCGEAPCQMDIFTTDSATGITTNITDSHVGCGGGGMNDRGDIVYIRQGKGSIPAQSANDYEVYLYEVSSGQHINISDNNVWDALPSINNSGDIVWQHGGAVPEGLGASFTGPDQEIYLYEASTGQIIQITDNDIGDCSPAINNTGGVAWFTFDVDFSTDQVEEAVQFYNRMTGVTTQLTDIADRNYNITRNQTPLNDNGDMALHGFVDFSIVGDGIYFFDFSTQNIVLVRDDPVLSQPASHEPVINRNGWIAWAEGGEIYLAIPTNTLEGAPTVTSGNISITFTSVTSPGNTSVAMSDTGPFMCEEYQAACLPPTYYDVFTTATYSGNIEVCVTYDDTICEENDLRLLQHKGDVWVDVTTSLDTNTNTIYGVTESLSTFLLAIPTPETVDIVMVLDRSGSMGGRAEDSPQGRTKIEVLRTAAKQFIEMMEADVGHRLGIVQFNRDVVDFPEDPQLDPALTELKSGTGESQEKKLNTVDAIDHGGSTSIGDGLRRALDQLATHPADGPHDRRILLVSDGKENQPQWISDVQPGLVGHNATVYCLGLGYEAGLNGPKLSGLAQATCGLYMNTANSEEFRELFIKAYGNAFDESQPNDPIKELKLGDSNTVTVSIAPVESRAIITAYWEAFPDAIDLDLITPSGQPITPSTTNERIRYVEDPYYVFYELQFPLADELATEWEGQWQAVMKRPVPAPAGAPETIRYGVSALVKGGVKFIVTFDRQLHLTGDVIQMQAQLVREGELLVGPQIDVFGDIPLIGVGNLLHDNYVDPNVLKQVQEVNGDPINMVDRKLQILNEQAGGGVLERGRAAPFQLYDDGLHGDGAPNDGLYGNSFTETKTQGSYTFRFVASEIPVAEDLTTTREWTKSFYTEVRVDPDYSGLSIQQTGVTVDGIKYAVEVVPGDRFGNYIGPGHDVTVEVIYPGGGRRISLTDNVDGIYTTEMLLTYEEYEANAQFNVSIDGEPFTNLWDPSLLAYWTLDEAEGLVAHDSVAGYDGILHGNPLWQSAAGQVNGAIQMDGMDDYISTPFVLDPSIGPFTIIMWIKGGAEGQVVISQQGGANWLLADSSTGTLASELGRTLRSDTLITDGVWHQIVLVWDGINRMLYADGVQVAMDEPGVLLSSGGGLYMGADKNLEGGRFWSGLIDDVHLYDRVRQP